MISSPMAVNQVQEKRIRYRYETSGKWYKGSIHLHTVRSDGHLTLDELVQRYSAEKIEYGENTVKVETSPVTYVRLIGPRRTGNWINALDRTPITRAELDLSPDWPYARLEIGDAVGKKAWSNPLWFSDNIPVP